MFAHFNRQLWLAVRGVAGNLPFQAEVEESESDWATSLGADAVKFRRDRR
jgi:hypothetical protein